MSPLYVICRHLGDRYVVNRAVVVKPWGKVGVQAFCLLVTSFKIRNGSHWPLATAQPWVGGHAIAWLTKMVPLLCAYRRVCLWQTHCTDGDAG